MSSGERDAFTGLLSSLIVLIIFYMRLSAQSGAGLFDGPDGLMVWARSVLWLIAIGIGVAIAVTIVFTVLYTALTGEKKLSDLRDERDRMIEHRGSRIGAILTAMALVGSIIDLAMGNPALHAFTLILIGCSLSEIVKDSFKIYCYRRGF